MPKIAKKETKKVVAPIEKEIKKPKIEVEVFDLSIDLEFHDWQIIHTPEYLKQKDHFKKDPWFQKFYMLINISYSIY